jgi:ABC-2 type transport system permease protein
VAQRSGREVRYRFGAGLFDTVVRKEWRLIRRDPHLISQVALQLIYLLPIFLLVFGERDIQYPAITAGLTLLCSSLTASLAWIVVSAEDAPDLLVMAPASSRLIRLAKLAAGAMPALAIAFIPLAWLVMREPLAGLLTCFTVSGATCTAAVIVHWCGKPATRSDYTTRGKTDTLTSLLEGANSLAWGGLGFCMSSIAGGSATDGYLAGAALTAMATVAILGLAWLLRRPRA